MLIVCTLEYCPLPNHDDGRIRCIIAVHLQVNQHEFTFKSNQSLPIAMPKYLTNSDAITQKQNCKQPHANQREHPRNNMITLRRPRIASKCARLTIARLQRLQYAYNLCKRLDMVRLIIRRRRRREGRRNKQQKDGGEMHRDASQERRKELTSYSHV
jgi:hypothetical protein